MHLSNLRSLLVAGACVIGATITTHAGTIACYRFETDKADHPFGTPENLLILDTSDHNFSLTPVGYPAASSEVPDDTVPGTGEKNARSIHFTGAEHAFSANNSGLGHVIFTSFTIETWVNFDVLEGWQTLIGRDDVGNPGEGAGAQSLFYLSKSTDIKPGPDQTENGLRVELINRENQILVVNSTLGVITGTWYHVAVVGDAAAGTLSLYVDGAKVGSTTGFTGLFIPKRNTAWTLGRGQYKGKPLDFFKGYMDEVRFSDTALSPQQFLSAARGLTSQPRPAPAPIRHATP